MLAAVATALMGLALTAWQLDRYALAAAGVVASAATG